MNNMDEKNPPIPIFGQHIVPLKNRRFLHQLRNLSPALAFAWAARVCTNMQLLISLLDLSDLPLSTQVSHLLTQLHYSPIHCQFNSDLYETLNLSSCATNP